MALLNNSSKFNRSTNYRTDFIDNHPGWNGFYVCAYCGKIIPKSKMEVDHVIPVSLSRKKRWYRFLLKGKSVNDKSNMVASCSRCNRRKSNKAGLWMLRGKIGPYIQPILWILFVPFLIYFTYWFFTSQIYLLIFNY